jgi:hypothetical protein
MLSKILKWCWSKKWFVIPAVVAIPVLLIKLLGGAGRWLSSPGPPSPPVLSHDAAERERERIKEHGDAARDAVNERADAFAAKLAKLRGGK